jgi:hypothetical protein
MSRFIFHLLSGDSETMGGGSGSLATKGSCGRSPYACEESVSLLADRVNVPRGPGGEPNARALQGDPRVQLLLARASGGEP